MASFYGWGSTTSRLEPLRRGSLLFNSGIEYKIPSVQSGYDANNNRFFSAVKRGGVTLDLFWLAYFTKIFFSST